MKQLYPGYIDNTSFKLIEIDGKYIATLCITAYPKELSFLQFISLLPKDYDYDMSIYLIKQDTSKVLQDLTYHISSTKAEEKTGSQNQIDVDILHKTNTDATKLRYEIQINNEEIYFVACYITLRSSSKADLLFTIQKFKSMLYVRMIVSSILNFRQLSGYLATLPLGRLPSGLEKGGYNNMTTSNVVNLFPFYTNQVFDEQGVLFGLLTKTNQICYIDIFKEEYLNANICLFGSSGSGKSYFIKLFILRQYFLMKKQYLFDLEGEYIQLAKAIGQEVISFTSNSTSACNIMEIEEIEIEQEGFLEQKIKQVVAFLLEVLQLETDYSDIVEQAVALSYLKKGISKDKDSMYYISENEKIYVNGKLKQGSDMPILSDVLANVKKTKKAHVVIDKLSCMLSKYPFLDKPTTLNHNYELLVLDFSSVDNLLFSPLFKWYMEYIIRHIRATNLLSLLYIDEVWNYMQKSEEIGKIIVGMFKTIRKLNAAIVAITQDISDFFAYQVEAYGKSIFNNCFFKLFFRLEYADSDILYQMGAIKKQDISKIQGLTKGNMILSFSGNTVMLQVKANEFEKKIIEEDEQSCDNISSK